MFKVNKCLHIITLSVKESFCFLQDQLMKVNAKRAN